MCTVALWCLLVVAGSGGVTAIPMGDKQSCEANANKLYKESKDRPGPYLRGHCIPPMRLL